MNTLPCERPTRAFTLDYITETGQAAVIDVFTKAGWRVRTWPHNGDISSATRFIPALNRDATFHFNRPNFEEVTFHNGPVIGTVFEWLPSENRFCTFTFRKLTAPEIPDYIALCIDNDTLDLTHRLLTYKSSF
jgi:hypothetical protein